MSRLSSCVVTDDPSSLKPENASPVASLAEHQQSTDDSNIVMSLSTTPSPRSCPELVDLPSNIKDGVSETSTSFSLVQHSMPVIALSDSAMDDDEKEPEILGMSVNDIMRKAVTTIVGQIPEVGGALSVLIGFFWKESKVDIWNEIKDRVEDMIHEKLSEDHVKQLQFLLSGLQKSFTTYDDTSIESPQKGPLFANLISELDVTEDFFLKSSDIPAVRWHMFRSLSPSELKC